MLIAASLLSADFMNLKASLGRVLGVDFFHVDVMDGHFVPNLTFGPCVLKNLHAHFDTPLDIHLMVENPLFFVDLCKDLQPAFITLHAESTPHLHRSVHYIKNLGIKAGVSLNPATPLCALDYIIQDVDLILLMSVNPGFGGQSFIPLSFEKIKAFRARFPHYVGVLEVDGGINAHNAPLLRACGVNLLVVGNYLFSHANPTHALQALRGRD
ncbi:ribulose-phosphate 3-epimerase [Helicobacter labacensis]|uniref:ribulose-phosphate 3-epimerase n=1 Tax=Helicobacter labacensis TaxID=2316079 RepID=UPI00196985E8|nr:ribulose-phosphate 3-epimerase [Helicobacter labacensis]